MHFCLHLNLGGTFYRRRSVYGMLISSLTGNRIRDTPISNCGYFIIHAFFQKVNAFFCVFKKIQKIHAKSGSTPLTNERNMLYYSPAARLFTQQKIGRDLCNPTRLPRTMYEFIFYFLYLLQSIFPFSNPQ